MRKRLERYAVFLLGAAILLSGCSLQKDVDAKTVYAKETENVDETPEVALSDLMEDKEYLANLTEDDKRELAAEVLKEEGKNSTIAEDGIAISGLSFELPEGFFADEEWNLDGFYVTRRYPLDASNILYQEAEEDLLMQMMDEKGFQTTLEKELTAQVSNDVTVEMISFEEIMIDEVPGFRVICSYQIEDITFTQLFYAVNGNRNFTITYTMTNEYDRMVLFEASASSIQIIR